MSRRVCLAIGAANAKPLAHLPGAANAARDIGRWAEAAGFDAVTVITDEGRVGGWRWNKGKAERQDVPAEPVTVQSIAGEIRALLPGDEETDLFFLHFAGHGLREGGASTLWMPTDWNSALRAVAVERLRHRLEEYGIKNLTIVSDACRSFVDSRKLDQLSLDGVLGTGITARVELALDRFNATYDGAEAYMIRGTSPDEARCILSGVLVDALWGDEPEAIDQYIANKITAGSLGEFLPGKTQQIGERYSLASKAEVFQGQPRDHVVYLDLASKPKPGLQRRSWPPATREIVIDEWDEGTRRGASTGFTKSFGARSERPRRRSRQVPTEVVRPYSGKANQTDQANRIRSVLETSQAGGSSEINLRLHGQGAIRLWSAQAAIQGRGSEWQVEVLNGATQVLVEFADGLFVPVVVYQDIATILARDGTGSFAWTHASDIIADAQDVVARMQAGLIAPTEIGKLAATIREQKHQNPMLGAIAAYLYDYVGDRDNIRRMAWYYTVYNQPVPYDIALMGLIDSRRNSEQSLRIDIPKVRQSATGENLPSYSSAATGAVSGYPVAGRCPWLRQGWAFAAAPEDAERALADGLGQLVPHLHHSSFTAFDRTGGERLIELWHLQESDR